MVNVTLETVGHATHLIIEEPSPADPLARTHARAEFAVEVCPSQLCHCCNMTFVERAADASQPGDRPRRFVLDPFARRPSGQTAPDDTDAALAREVAGALTADSWRNLSRLFMDVKARALATIDCAKELADFPFDEIERDGVMVSYRETIPFDREMLFGDGTRQMLADEQHCVRPDCDCTEAVLTLHEVDPAPRADGTRTATQLATLRVDHQTGRWSDADTGRPLGDEALALRRLLLAAHPDLLATLARQQALLRQLYRTAVAAAGPVVHAPARPLAAAPRIGRNDPCPCGSGRKYKKCCLPS